jgi:GT2 family glycosyltransferase
MTSVDIVVPSYNYAHLLPQCIESLFKQEAVKIRALVLDDASTDETPTLAAQLCSRYPGLEYRRHERNAGHIATYNEGLLGWATAPYVLLLSADDLLARGAMRRAVEAMERDPEIGMVCGIALLFETADDIARAPKAKSNGLTDEPDLHVFDTGQLLRECVRGNPISTPTMVVRTALQRAVGPYARELPHTADVEMWMRFATHSKVAVTRHVQAYKRLHGSNMSKSYFGLRNLRERLKAFEFALQRDPETFALHAPPPEYISRIAAEQAVWLASAYCDVSEPAGARECLDFARETWPRISASSMWRRTQLKLRLGPRLTSRARGVSTLLGLAGRPQAVIDPRLGPQPGTLQGWWPSPTQSPARTAPLRERRTQHG